MAQKPIIFLEISGRAVYVAHTVTSGNDRTMKGETIMRHRMTRRHMLALGAAAPAVMNIRPVHSAPAGENTGPGRERNWAPGPDRDLVRDLTPGITTVRLAGYLAVNEGEGIGEAVRKLREQSLTAAITGAEAWHDRGDSEIRELRDALRQHDVEIFEIGGYRNLIHTDPAVRREYQKHIAYCLETAEKIGCRMVGTISGSRNPVGNEFVDNYAVHPDNWTLETWNILIESLRIILRDTAGMKAAIGMEAQVTTNIDGPLAHRRLIEDMGDERIRVNFDPTNMVHLFNHFHTTELINVCFDLLGEDIIGCHAKDTYVLPHSQTVHVQEVCPGRGNLDYETYLVRLSRMKWPRALLPEHIPAEQYDEAYRYIRTVADRVGVRIHG